MATGAIQISVKTDAEAVMSQWKDKTVKQVSYALRKAITKTAEDVRQAEYAEMRSVFDRPTPWTLNSIENKLIKTDPPTARVWLKYYGGGTPAEKFLSPEVFGGERGFKRFENALKKMGLMDPSLYAVPGEAAPLDQYGNIPASFIRRLLSYLGAGEMTAGYSSNITQARKAKLRRGTKTRQGYAFFVEQHRTSTKRPLGIYMTAGRFIRPLIIFVRAPRYRPLLKWEEVARRTVDMKFKAHFNQAMLDQRNT